MNKYKVEGRIRADIEFEIEIEAKSEKSAIRMAEKQIYDKCGITSHDVIDDEIYCEKVK
jgi:hypothetical protein